jgi:serine protease
MLGDNVGNSLSTAIGFDITSSPQTFTNQVSPLHADEYYKFTLSGRSSFNLGLNGLSADADVQLIQDINGNGAVDNGEQVAISQLGGSSPESIAKTLNSGSYYIHVYPYGNSTTNYNLTVSAISDRAGNSLDSAYGISLGAGATTYTDWVGKADSDDYYTFNLNSSSNFSMQLSGVTTSVDAQLLNATGDVLSSAAANSTTPNPNLVITLDTGKYYVHITPHTGDSYYNLSLSATPTPLKNQIVPTSSDATTTVSTPIVTTAAATPITTATSNTRTVAGTLRADTFTYQPGYSLTVFSGNGDVDYGNYKQIGNKTLDILDLSKISFGSVTWNQADTNTGGVLYNPGNGTRLFDAVTLSDGSEILFEDLNKVIFADKTIDLSVTPSDPLFDQQWNLQMMGVENAWRFTQGSNQVLLGIADTGLGTDSSGNIHSDLRATNFVGNNYLDKSAKVSHGTSVEGVIGAAGNNGVGISGINWNSPILMINVVGNDPGVEDLVTATQTMIDRANANGQHLVVNLSIAGGDSPEFEQLVTKNQDNALFVFAAGNGDTNSIANPASLAQTHSNVMAIGASWGSHDYYGNAKTPGDRITYAGWWGSNYGSGLTLMAPSEYIAPSATRNADGTFSFAYNSNFNGTSAATPNASAVASLVWSANSHLTATQVRDVMTQTAYDLSTPGYDTTTGYGFINADAAVRRAIALSRGVA